MTREEARGLLMRCEAESYCPHYLQKFNCDGCKQRIALDMAIEALQTENKPYKVIAEVKVDIDEIVEHIKEKYVFTNEVVRCKDCRHSDTTGVYVEDVVYCKWLHTSCVKNGYCHRGERKGGDTE